MKMVDDSRRHDWQPFCFVIMCICFFGNLFVPEAIQGAVVTKTIQFNQADGFNVNGSFITASGVDQYVIEGMDVGISTGVFLYPQRNSGEWWSGQPDDSTSLGSQAAGTGPIQFSLALDSPAPGQTFDMESITLLGYSEPSVIITQNVTVTFTGTKIVAGNPVSVTLSSASFNSADLSPLVVVFNDDFHGLTGLSWNQGVTARAHQFDNIVFSTVTAVPEPGSLLTMLVAALAGILAHGRRWIGERLSLASLGCKW